MASATKQINIKCALGAHYWTLAEVVQVSEFPSTFKVKFRCGKCGMIESTQVPSLKQAQQLIAKRKIH